MSNEDASQFYLGTVTGASSSGVNLILDGHSSALQKTYKQLNTGSQLAQGDRVVVMKMSGTYIVLGRISYDNTGGGGSSVSPSSTIPKANGTASTGQENAYARGDHVHPATPSTSIPVAEKGEGSTYYAAVVTIPEFESETLRDGLQFYYYTGTSGGTDESATMNVNNMGAKPIRSANNVDAGLGLLAQRWYLFWYSSSMVSGGCWVAGQLTDKNTTYSSKAAVEDGTDTSLVTTGEKYVWNNKANASDIPDLTPSSVTPSLVETLPTGVTATSIDFVRKSGYVVNIGFMVTRDTNEIENWSTLWSGLPMPSTFVRGAAMPNTSNFTQPLLYRITADGMLQVARGQISTGRGSYYVEMTYIASSL